MDESIPDGVTKEEWKTSYELAQEIFGSNFKKYLDAATGALKEVKGDSSLVRLVAEQTNKILQDDQTKIMILRAAAYEILNE